jgi:hypothetical protein
LIVADTGAPFFLPYPLPTDLVRDGADDIKALAEALAQALEDIPVKEKRVETFTGSTTWTVPAGVTFAKVTLTGAGGGGGGGNDNRTTGAGQAGAASTFVHNSVTSSCPGGKGAEGGTNTTGNFAYASPANTGRGGSSNQGTGDGNTGQPTARNGINTGTNAPTLVFGRTLTPGGTATITVGAGGAGGVTPNGATGGTGFVIVEYEVEV